MSRRQLAIEVGIGKLQLEPLLAIEICQNRLGQLGTLAEPATGNRGFTFQQACEASKSGLLVDAVFLFQVLAIVSQLGGLDLLRAGVFFQAIASEDLHVNDGTLVAGGDTQRGVFHVRRLLTEDGTQQLLFRCQLSLTFWRDLAH